MCSSRSQITKKGEKIIPRQRAHRVQKPRWRGWSLAEDVDDQTRADPVIHAQESCLYCKKKWKQGKDFRDGVTCSEKERA